VLQEFAERVGGLGDRLGPVRVQLINQRDEGMVELILGSLDPGVRLAFDLEHPSWDGIEPRLAAAGAVRVNDLEHAAPFRYVRFRDPPYSDDELQGGRSGYAPSTSRCSRISGTKTSRPRRVCAAAHRATRLAEAALLVRSGDGGLQCVLLPFVGDVGRIAAGRSRVGPPP
jgi:hypothetical protein